MNVPAVVTGTVIVAVFTVEVIVWFAPPFTVYTNVYGAVPPIPVNVTVGAVPFTHTADDELPIVAVGNGLMVTELPFSKKQPVDEFNNLNVPL